MEKAAGAVVPDVVLVEGLGVEEVERIVRQSRVGDAPPKGEGLPQAWFTVKARMDPVQSQTWENAVAKLRAEMGCPEELSLEEVMVEMARMVLVSEADGSMPGRTPVDGSLYKVVVAEQGSTVEGEDGSEPIDAATLEAVTSDGATPDSLRRKVLGRDGHRCQNCRTLRGLHVHHVVWRSLGGPTKADNLVTLCARCHGLVHTGLLEVKVAQCAASGIRFEFTGRGRRRLGRHLPIGPKVLLRAAQCATPASELPKEIPARLFRDHMDWFDTRNGKLTLKPSKRAEFVALVREWSQRPVAI